MACSKKEIGTGFITEVDRYLYGEGTHYEIYEKLGAHPKDHHGKKGMYFAVWAPHAVSVSVVGDFNGWNPDVSPMEVLDQSGIYELFIPGLGIGELYKYAITTATGKILFKADPFAFEAEYRPGTASITTDLSGFSWKDSTWMKKRQETDLIKSPLSIYEVHLGSWKKTTRNEKDGYYTYIEAAHELAAYVKEMGYTHVELMGIAEHPYDGSWGYQVTGYYAPTSRYGSPDEFKQFVDACHQNGISVILDWVPAHFPKDDFALARFDGTALYEHQDPRLGEHIQWGTYIFNYGRKEVANFLLANALYWMDIFHIDGLRVDAVASLLRLDFCKEEGQWLPNVYGGSENLEAIEFLKHMNSVIAEREPGALMIAEDSTAWPGVTKKVDEGGLGFSLKWNMGWMNDFLSYIKLDPIYRKYHQNKLTFGMAYHYAENFVLVLSHDEVVHTKSSMIGKMPGDVWQSFANLRLSYGFMMGHPGKKLLFMGGEFAQYSEWSEARSLDWHLLQYADHQEMQAYVKELNHLYTEEPAFWAEDFDPNGFQWIECDDAESSIVSFVRRSEEKELVFLCNFTPVVHRGFSLGVPQEGVYHERLNSDAARFGGSDVINAVPLQSKAEPAGRCPFRVELDVPPLGMVILEREQPKKQPRTKKPKTRTAANGTKTDAKRKHPEKNTEKTAKQADLP